MKAKFKPGDAVRWSGLALKGAEQNGWIVVRMSHSTGLQPCYDIRHELTGERGNAPEWDLQPQLPIESNCEPT